MDRSQKSLHTIFIIYFILLLLFAVAPINGDSHSLNDIFILKLRSDYFFHALQFVPWIFFGIKTEKKFLYWLLFGLIIASATEGIQFFLPYRSFNVNDLMANLIGVIGGLFSLIFVFKRNLSEKA